jgi:hypothetical protein
MRWCALCAHGYAPLIREERKKKEEKEGTAENEETAREGQLMTLGSHQQCVGKSQGHITPKWLLDRIGPFDLDPCAAVARPWDCAIVNWTSNGLEQPWFGFAYVNSPFNRYVVGDWVARLAQHGHGIALIHVWTETEWFEGIWHHARAILFLVDRIKFCLPDGTEQPHNSGAPLCLVAFGSEALLRLQHCGLAGILVTSWQIQPATDPIGPPSHGSCRARQIARVRSDNNYNDRYDR